MGLLSGKNVLVTGALGSIGRSLVTRYLEEGASVVALDLPGKEGLFETFFPAENDVRFFGCDLEDLATTESKVKALADEGGGVDILVNNAVFATRKPHEEFSIADYEKQIRINSSATFILSRACGQHMKQRRYGKIVCLITYLLYGHMEQFTPYIASKGAVYGLVKALARELGKHGINVNGIAPGAVRGEVEPLMYGDGLEEYNRWVLEHQSIKRRIEPLDIANLAIFLSSHHADMIAGQNIHCDGGW